MRQILAGLFLVAAALGSSHAYASDAVGSIHGIEVLALGSDEARPILGKKDGFTDSLSPFDRKVRRKVGNSTGGRYLDFVSEQALSFSTEELRMLEEVVDEFAALTDGLVFPLDAPVYLIKTTGREEFGLPYTRGRAIVLPEDTLSQDLSSLVSIFGHELIHVISRNYPEFREAAYGIINFRKFAEAYGAPSEISGTVTNPDGYDHNYLIDLEVDGMNITAVPIIFSEFEVDEIADGWDLVNNLEFRLAVVVQTVDSKWEYAKDSEGQLLLYEAEETNLLDLVGTNTTYIIHPDEIIASNFQAWLESQAQGHGLPLPDQWVVDELIDLFSDKS